MITERLLQYIWEKRYYNMRDMRTVQGQKLEVVEPGKLNRNQGPDFLVAFIRLDDDILVGNIEIHIRSSEWFRHAHQYDSNYGNVILHVVWEQEEEAPNIPAFELRGRVAGTLLSYYRDLMMAPRSIACSNLLHGVNRQTWETWKIELLRQRLIRKAVDIGKMLESSTFSWDQVLWCLVGRAFGLPVNGDAFEAVMRSVPWHVLMRLREHPLSVEAILMGQAGMLDGRFTDDYPRRLHREYQYQMKKYGLKAPALKVKLLRMRPASLPGVRMAQLAALVPKTQHLLQRCRDARSAEELKDIFRSRAASYWDTHYRFDEESAESPKRTGDHLLNIVILNAVVPVVFTYGRLNYMTELEDKAIQWLLEIDPEKNKFLAQWRDLGQVARNAADSQAFLELSIRYCMPRRCLDCSIARSILRGNPIGAGSEKGAGNTSAHQTGDGSSDQRFEAEFG